MRTSRTPCPAWRRNCGDGPSTRVDATGRYWTATRSISKTAARLGDHYYCSSRRQSAFLLSAFTLPLSTFSLSACPAHEKHSARPGGDCLHCRARTGGDFARTKPTIRRFPGFAAEPGIQNGARCAASNTLTLFIGRTERNSCSITSSTRISSRTWRSARRTRRRWTISAPC